MEHEAIGAASRGGSISTYASAGHMSTPPLPSRREVLRFVAVLPVAVLCWWASLLLGFALDSLAMHYCPPESILSGFCTASWAPRVHQAIVVFCAGFAAFTVVVVPSAVAPRPAQRPGVALVLLIFGLFAAGLMAMQAGAHQEAIAAAVGGAMGWLLVRVWLTRPVFL